MSIEECLVVSMVANVLLSLAFLGLMAHVYELRISSSTNIKSMARKTRKSLRAKKRKDMQVRKSLELYDFNEI